ncbi:MAG: response regulator transcription factor [Ruminococcus sp.]|jgi:two-component system LytT family response regulator|uniref:LytR/AlgR family response regulator transcription factor n=1 Tax=Ruminococcus sp. TaxID=41978 RepID=UPI001B2751D2|nr:LytTR family DNA-binding domain-containing protein [Ruminococcus sp.]MBO7472395.1 response regulator transcription factor [Ruminococcus sp.]MBP5431771.1 response regulator transcription factor [Ruminococcus sp.]
MIKIAICDDDKSVITSIKEAITDFGAANSVEFEIHSFSSGEKLVESELNFDLIFLDIEMSGIDGIKTAKLIRPTARRSRIVYVTNHSELALQSYSVHPFDFVVKPFKRERITHVLGELMKYLADTAEPESVIQLKGMDGPLLLNLKNIYVFEYTGNRRITVYTKSETYCIKGSLSEIFSLIDSESFTSPHKSFIINMEHIDKLSGFTLYTTNGIEVPVAQKKLKEFHNAFSSFIKNYIKQE